jgi:two-component system, sensor histidine kinase and response regulator
VLLAAAAGSAIACTVAAWRAPRRRAAWIAAGVGSLLWGVASAHRPVWASLDGASVDVAPIGGVAAAGAGLALSAAMLLHLQVSDRLVTRLRSLTEALMITSGVLFAGTAIVLPAATAAVADLAPGGRVLLLAYPAADGVVLAIAAFVATRTPSGDRSCLLLLGGVAVLAVAGCATSLLGDETALWSASRGGTVLGLLTVVLAARRAWNLDATAASAADSGARRHGQLLLLCIPGLTVLIVLGATVRPLGGAPIPTELTWVAIGILVLSAALHLTASLENHALCQELALARDEAIRASALKSQILANMGHEIRTPMNAVIGLTGLLLDTELEAEQRELAVGVATSAEGLLGLIDDILDFSKAEADEMSLEDVELDLEDLLDEVGLIVAEPARRKGVEVVVYCEPGLVTARRGDPVRLRQIVLNLAANAVKFTPRGSVTIRALAAPGGPEQVVFQVIDTGIGIPPMDRERLFEPFSQLDESTTRKFGGTGLGLAIVTELVELHGGSIDLASEEGVGTTFGVTLPLAVGSQQRTERALAALKGLRAIVVDANAVNRSVLAHTLHGWGFVVDQAASAEEALDHFGWTGVPGRTYALALIDDQLEGMGGLQLADVLRLQQPMASAVVLLFTSSVGLSRQDAHDVGIRSVLIKPVRNAYLLRRIMDHLIDDLTPAASGGPDQREHAHVPSPAR